MKKMGFSFIVGSVCCAVLGAIEIYNADYVSAFKSFLIALLFLTCAIQHKLLENYEKLMQTTMQIIRDHWGDA